MKRASLKTAKVPLVSSTSLDVTDRILKTEPTLSHLSVPAAKAKPAPALKRASRTPKTPAGTASSTPPDLLAQALSQTSSALAALQNARASAPAQYDLAIRYRLDALAHHLQQVTDFITRQTS
jgi:hypothetical protein